MKLLYDRLRKQMLGTPVQELLEDATVFFNDDALQCAVNNEVELEMLPSLAPPYEKFFIECRIPKFDEIKKRGAMIMPRIGVMITALDYPDGVLAAQHSGVVYRWSYEMILFMENANNGSVTHIGAGCVLLDEDGQAMPFASQSDEKGYCYFTWNAAFFEQIHKTYDAERGYEVLPQTIIDAALYTVGMLHCKNIGTDIIEPSRAESHKFEKKFGMPMARYHVLKITGKGSSAGQQIGAPTGEQKPLHWCRGHFKTYSEEAPLMGQFVGTWYWNAQIRGKASKGIVTKDYQVAVEPEKRMNP